MYGYIKYRFIKCDNGHGWKFGLSTLFVNYNDTIYDIKRKIQKKTGAHVRLIEFESKVLYDEYKVSQCNIKKDNTIRYKVDRFNIIDEDFPDLIQRARIISRKQDYNNIKYQILNAKDCSDLFGINLDKNKLVYNNRSCQKIFNEINFKMNIQQFRRNQLNNNNNNTTKFIEILDDIKYKLN